MDVILTYLGIVHVHGMTMLGMVQIRGMNITLDILGMIHIQCCIDFVGHTTHICLHM